MRVINDIKKVKLLDDYMQLYEDCFEQCNAILWTIVPADQNWYKENIITKALLDILKVLDMKYPGLKK